MDDSSRTTPFWQRPITWLYVGLGVFVAYFGLTVLFRQANFYTSEFDLGNMEQVLWHSLHGRWFQMTDPGSGMLVSRTAIHADWLLLIYLPLYALWHSPVVMLVAQVLAVASGAIPLFLLARKKVSGRFAAIIAWVYLLYPPLHWALLFDVHAVVLVTPLILWAWWAVAERRWWLVALFLGLALLGKEEVGLLVAMNGLYWLVQRRTGRLGVVSVVVGLAWSILAIGWFIPQARHIPGHFALNYYSAYGNTAGQIVRTVATKPWIIVHDMLGPGRPHYYGSLLLPAAGLSFLGLPVLLIALPEIAINALSNDPNMQTIFFQYTSAITPYVFLSALFGWAWWSAWLSRRQTPWLPTVQRWLTGAVAVMVVFFVWRWAPLPGMRFGQDAWRVFQRSSYRDGIAAVQKLVRPEDRLAVTNNVAPHFSQRDLIWGFPNHLDQADGIIVLEGGDYDLLPPDQINQRVTELLSDPAFTLAYQHQDLYYFQRVKLADNVQ